MSLHTMPLNVGDFLRDTQELNDAEGGAYIFILIALWGSKEGRLPNNQAVLRRIARCGPKKWASTWPALTAYLEVSDDWITHKRVSSERQRVAEKVAKNRSNGKKGGEANALNYQDTDKANASANASAKTKRTLKQSKPNSPYGENSEPKGSGAEAPETPETIKAQIWAVGRPMFEKAGTSKAAAGVVIGKLIKTKGEVEALSIITTMRGEPPMDPEQYLWAIIRGKAAPTADPGAPQQLELVMIDGKPAMLPISRVAA